jgi:ribonuclease HI
MNNEVVSQFSLRLRIENFAHLLKACFFNHQTVSTTKLVKWNALGSTTMILNVDGSSIGNPGVSGFGGLIRNSDGAWVHGFAGNIGFSNILHAELLALYHGLLHAWELGIIDLQCYSDSKTVITLTTDPTDEWHHYTAIILNIKDVLARDWRVRISHTLREGNACADYLAKYGAHHNEAFTTIASPPAGINLLLLADASGTWFHR